MTQTAAPGVGAGIPGYRVGEWIIDPSHTEVSFRIRHTLIWLRGRFLDVTGTIVTPENPLESSVSARIAAASFTSNLEKRDNKIRFMEEFLWSAKFPEITFTSAGMTAAGDDRNFTLTGDLVVRGITKRIVLPLVLEGVAWSKLYGTRAGFTSRITLDRRDFLDVKRRIPIESTVPLSDENNMLGFAMEVDLQIEAVLSTDQGDYTW